MRLGKRHTLDDVDVASCLANLHRIEAITAPQVVVDLRTPVPDEEAAAPAVGQATPPIAARAARPEVRRPQPLSAGARDDR
jgi:hypothetical protein